MTATNIKGTMIKAARHGYSVARNLTCFKKVVNDVLGSLFREGEDADVED